jgi:hypothetical protein
VNASRKPVQHRVNHPRDQEALGAERPISSVTHPPGTTEAPGTGKTPSAVDLTLAGSHATVRAPVPRGAPPAAASPGTSRTRCPARGFSQLRRADLGEDWSVRRITGTHAPCRNALRRWLQRTSVRYATSSETGWRTANPPVPSAPEVAINPDIETASFAPSSGQANAASAPSGWKSPAESAVTP